MNNKKGWQKHIDFLLLDLFSLVVSFVLAFYLRHNHFNVFSLDIYKEMLFVIIVLNILIFFFYDPFKYVVRRGYLVELKYTFVYDFLSFAGSIIYLFVVKSSSEYSRITLFLTYILYFFISYITRILWKKHIQNKAKNAVQNGDRSLLILCKEKEIKEVIDNICRSNYDYYYISGICVVDKDLSGKKYKNYKIVANLKNLLQYVSTNWVDDILIATNYKSIPNKILNGLKLTGIPIHVRYYEIDIFKDRKQVIELLGDMNVITAVKNEHSFIEIFIKRLGDIIGSIVGCIITLLLIIVIGPIIYIKSPGNIFYVSDRVGKNGKIFKFYKFRSMILEADDLKESLKKKNRVKDGMMFKVDDDPRIIPGIGQFIRKTSIDEFPQFFNVLKNDMSIVGTRPPTIDEWNRYSPYYRSRLSIKPGITGLWQVSGRSNITNFDEVVRLDNEYIDNWSLALDIKIIIKTITNSFNKGKDGAM